MNIFVLTGAGVSAESGLGTFRDKDGLWSRFDPLKLATPEAFSRDPNEVHAFYNMRRRNLIEAAPNAAHYALARLEARLKERGGSLTLVTQNIDDLHERAGSQQVIHMHGELLKARCVTCEAIMPGATISVSRHPALPVAVQVAFVRMSSGSERCHSSWTGSTTVSLMPTCSLRLEPQARSIRLRGSSSEARGHGIRTCEINLEPSDNARQFDERRYGPASEAVPAWVEDVLT